LLYDINLIITFIVKNQIKKKTSYLVFFNGLGFILEILLLDIVLLVFKILLVPLLSFLGDKVFIHSLNLDNLSNVTFGKIASHLEFINFCIAHLSLGVSLLIKLATLVLNLVLQIALHTKAQNIKLDIFHSVVFASKGQVQIQIHHQTVAGAKTLIISLTISASFFLHIASAKNLLT
jgi:hypothetical protein